MLDLLILMYPNVDAGLDQVLEIGCLSHPLLPEFDEMELLFHDAIHVRLIFFADRGHPFDGPEAES